MQVAAVGGVVGQHLTDRPVEVFHVGLAQQMRLGVFVAHFLCLDKDLKIDVDAAKFFVLLVGEIIERLRIAGFAFKGFRSERRKSLHRHDERRDRCREILCEERPERLVFPRLDVAGGPVVDETEAEDLFLRLADRNRRSKLIPVPDKEADLHLVIEILARDKNRRSFRVAAILPVRPLDVRAADHNARSPPVITDRHILIIRQQRSIRPKHRSYIRSVIDRAVEVGVVADF